MRITAWFAVVAAVVLSACATTPPFDLKNVNTATTPSEAVAKLDALRGSRVLWGGVIVNSKNLEKGTQLEILAYPLSERHRPRLDREPLGRFIIEHGGYLETVDYAPGRELSLTGTITGTKEGKIDAASYIYPAVASEQIHLWSKGGNGEPQFHFGVGVMFHN
mgnify:CR=1 FL=1